MAKKKTAAKKSRARTPPFAAYPAWSEAKFWSFLRSNIRRASSKWPPIYEAKAAARRPNESSNKRLKWEYQCAKCGGWFPDKEVSVDHTVPVGTLKCWEDLPGFCERLFCSSEGLQVLCSTCHGIKTAEERGHA